MALVRFIIWILVFSVFYYLYDNRKVIMNPVKIFFIKNKIIFQRVYRLLSASRSANFVWQELIKYFKTSGLRFGQYNLDKQIACSFLLHDNQTVDFDYTVKNGSLTFRAIVLASFDEDLTNDLFVLASHFNGLLNFGVVRVSSTNNFISYVHMKDLLIYSLFPGEINSDMKNHLELTSDITWAFNHLIETGDDPVFVFSEFLRRLDRAKMVQ